MLTYNISLASPTKERKIIKFDEDTFYCSNDFSIITGTCDTAYNIVNFTDIDVSGNGGIYNFPITSSRVSDKGWITLEDESYVFHKTDNNVNYVEIDGIFYKIDNNTNCIFDEYGNIIGKSTNSETVELLQEKAKKYHIYDDYVEIGGSLFYAEQFYDEDNISKISLTLEEGDNTIYDGRVFIDDGIQAKYYDTAVYKDKFEITTSINHEVTIIEKSYGKKHYFFNEDCCREETKTIFLNPYYSTGDMFLSYSANTTSKGLITFTGDETTTMDGVENISGFTIQNRVVNANSGDSLLLTLSESLSVGDVLHCSSISPIEDFIKYNNEDSIIINNQEYKVWRNAYKYAIINDLECEVTEISSNDCLVIMNGESVRFVVDGGQIKLFKDSKEAYDILTKDVLHAQKAYYSDNIEFTNASGDKDNIKGFKINEVINFDLIITDKIGSSVYLCQPKINIRNLTYGQLYEIRSKLCAKVLENSFEINTKDTRLYNGRLDDNLFLDNLNIIKHNTGEIVNPKKLIKLYSNDSFYNIQVSLSNLTQPNPGQEDIVNRQFFEREKEKSINPIIDMEKDVYSPVIPKWYTNNSKSEFNKNGEREFEPVKEIHFNLHFRTRDLSNWKVIEDNYETMLNEELKDKCNWFVTDFYPYNTILNSGSNDRKNELLRTPDLVGLIDFNNNDVYRQKRKLEKSFLRVSLYDSINPGNQSLLSTSTIWVEEGELAQKFISFKKTRDRKFARIGDKIIDKTTFIDKTNTSDSISVFSEEIDNNGTPLLSEKTRLSCKFVVKNKYEDSASSEGFYHYIFKEYATKMHPKRMYMKVEFNHAGIGRMLPFILPMKWDDNDNPTSALTFTNAKDVETLKKGIPLRLMLKQLYIPINAIYDDINKQYVYYPDKEYYNDVDIKDGIMEFNLFELKIKDIDKDLG